MHSAQRGVNLPCSILVGCCCDKVPQQPPVRELANLVSAEPVTTFRMDHMGAGSAAPGEGMHRRECAERPTSLALIRIIPGH